MTEGYPLPRDVSYIYASPVPLPAGDPLDPGPAVDADRDTPARDRNAAIRGFSTPLLFGAITYERRKDFDDEQEYYNTALLVAPDGRVLGRYDKNYLLIFGEHIPFADWFPFLKSWLPEAGDYRPGRTVEVFDLDSVRIGLMICYEDIIPSFTRKLADKDPNILINITNDAWFGKTSEPWQHLQLAAFRAIENRRYLLRSTNTGVSAVIDPVGRIVSHTSLEGAETLTADIAVLSGETIYQRFGDVFAWACCALGLLLVIASMAKKGSKKSS
ncbi:MAG: apolipoprotein N-acyltransferase, partial [Deltaproteobacteria bacterium]|nr:apolipoprotein N-acyltransferase [Deltaproteobacteria bacterium]